MEPLSPVPAYDINDLLAYQNSPNSDVLEKMNTLQTYITSLVREQGELTRNIMQTSFKEQLSHQNALTGVVIKKLEEMVKLLSSSDKTTDGAHANL